MADVEVSLQFDFFICSQRALIGLGGERIDPGKIILLVDPVLSVVRSYFGVMGFHVRCRLPSRSDVLAAMCDVR